MWGQGQHGAPHALPSGGSGEVGEAPDPRAADQSAAHGQHHHQHAQSEGQDNTLLVLSVFGVIFVTKIGM